MATQWTVDTLYKLYNDKQIVKPRIQRQKRWDLNDNKEYINFMNKWRKIIIPILFNETIVDSKKQYILFDGNNRVNAILDFIIAPLSILDELIPLSLFSSKTILQSISLNDFSLKSRTYCLNDFYKEYPESKPHCNFTSHQILEQNKDFQDMLDNLSKFKFLDIPLQITIENNLSIEDMCDLYTSINKGGKVLSQQELLASSTHAICFTSKDIKDIKDIKDNKLFIELNGCINEYYGAMNSNEKIHVDTKLETKLTLFEVLVAFQNYLSKKYNFVMIYKGENKKTDLVFDLFEYMGGNFIPNKDNLKDYNINTIISKIIEGCEIVDKYYKRLYNSSIDIKIKDKDLDIKDDKYQKKIKQMKKNTLVLIIMYIYYAKTKDNVDAILLNISRVLLYHDIINELPSEQRDEQGIDCLGYHSGGTYIKMQVNKIKDRKTFDRIPEITEIRNLLHSLLEYETKPSNTRKSISRLKLIAYNVFCSFQIPINLQKEPQHIDHIVPFSTKNKDKVDICRLGNLQIIPKDINASRSNKPITNKWIEENSLKYQNYPDEKQYELICKDKTLCNNKEYNTMCESREKVYIDLICKTLEKV